MSGVAFEITADRRRFQKSSKARINYSGEDLGCGLWIEPHGLLDAIGHHHLDNLGETEWNGLFAFFRRDRGDLPFDIFAAAFYLLSSYEEYFSPSLDRHGRFDHEASLLFRHGLLETPIIDRWAEMLRERLKSLFPKLVFQPRKYRFINTFDIDYPYRYRCKGIAKNFAGLIRDISRRDYFHVRERILVCLRLKGDPYFEAIRMIDDYHARAGKNCLLFVLLGRYGKYGRSTVYPTPFWHKALSRLHSAKVGLHPSYDSLNNPQTMLEEKQQLRKILHNQTITAMRRHFLRYVCPTSFIEATEAGFTDDYSLAFAQTPGFRSGTAIPYRFYDVCRDQPSPLLIHPTVVMDTSLIIHQHMSPDDAIEKIQRLARECQRSGGDFTMLWHNSNLAGDERLNHWIYVFKRICQFADSL
jgi:hypothetical protein